LLHRFGGINAMEELNGSHVHRLQNILTLNANLDTWFHELKIWLERDPMVMPIFIYIKSLMLKDH